MTRSLDRGLRILDEIAAGRRSLGAISESLGVHKSTVLRLLATLQQHHYVYRENASTYRLGRKLYDLSSFALDSQVVAPRAREPMQALLEATGHWVYLAALEGDAATVVAALGDDESSGAGLRAGDTLSLTSSAAGRVLLSSLSRQQQDSRMESLDTDRQEVLREDLAELHRSGCAVQISGEDGNTNAVAVEVRNSEGDIVAALGVAGEHSQFGEARIAQILPRLYEAAAETSRELS